GEQPACPHAAEPGRRHAAIAAFYRRMWPVIAEARAEPLELVEDDDRVTVTLAMSVRLARTGLVSRWRDRHACTLRDAKIVQYVDPHRARPRAADAELTRRRRAPSRGDLTRPETDVVRS